MTSLLYSPFHSCFPPLPLPPPTPPLLFAAGVIDVGVKLLTRASRVGCMMYCDLSSSSVWLIVFALINHTQSCWFLGQASAPTTPSPVCPLCAGRSVSSLLLSCTSASAPLSKFLSVSALSILSPADCLVVRHFEHSSVCLR